ncbi:GIY-YIG nuclease family protein [Nostoc sp. FACHB-190]|uniref:GIY-YIG nuclease family protein n=1 Tax=Nostoc sp. FACHB-190 TaxID=2692838 RepID=UPI001F55843D|nr:GIY-YIG nuclease family protein [Nostoc sp. FACHB-190]
MESSYFSNGYQPRNDHEPGYIYLMEAEGYHGLIPGFYLRRCKIGLSRNPQLRLENFHANQPPCNIKILTTVYVQDMAEVETQLHNQFKHCQVKGLVKSREWFDFNPLQMAMVRYAIAKYDIHVFTFDELPVQLILLCLLGLLSLGIITGRLTSQPVTQSQEQLKTE